MDTSKTLKKLADIRLDTRKIADQLRRPMADLNQYSGCFAAFDRVRDAAESQFRDLNSQPQWTSLLADVGTRLSDLAKEPRWDSWYYERDSIALRAAEVTKGLETHSGVAAAFKDSAFFADQDRWAHELRRLVDSSTPWVTSARFKALGSALDSSAEKIVETTRQQLSLLATGLRSSEEGVSECIVTTLSAFSKEDQARNRILSIVPQAPANLQEIYEEIFAEPAPTHAEARKNGAILDASPTLLPLNNNAGYVRRALLDLFECVNSSFSEVGVYLREALRYALEETEEKMHLACSIICDAVESATLVQFQCNDFLKCLKGHHFDSLGYQDRVRDWWKTAGMYYRHGQSRKRSFRPREFSLEFLLESSQLIELILQPKRYGKQ